MLAYPVKVFFIGEDNLRQIAFMANGGRSLLCLLAAAGKNE